MGAGNKRVLLWFQERSLQDDGFGNMVAGEFETRVTAAAELRPLRGSEPVQAARLQGQQPHIAKIRSSAKARDITTAWRAVDARNNDRTFAVIAPATDDTSKNAFLEILIQEGTAE